ncbi:glycosyltransferase family 4 protein [Patescibacteria group bacterium]|nr:glycosyltransferase family 4 protein [Patescibacteria group bacterium]
MTIGINGYEAVVPRFGFDKKTGLPSRVGSSEFCFRLLLNLAKLDKKNRYKIYIPPLASGLNPQGMGLPAESEAWSYVFVRKRIRPWTATDLSLQLFNDRKRLDVFFSPTHYLPFYTPKKSIVTILDLSYIHFPHLFTKKDLFMLKWWGGYSIKKASDILTISMATRNDIIKTYKISGGKVAVAYPGIKKISDIRYQTSDMDKLRKKYGINGEYILFVGTLQPRKNIARLVEAFSKINNQETKSKELSLVIVGKKGWMWEEILRAPKKFGVEGRVRFLESVSDRELPLFYQNALCFVLPSLYEGFGLPVLEAMQYGAPVITSNVSSLPEAGGDAAVYIDPYNISDITNKLELVIRDSELRQKMIKKGLEQVKKFSWEKTARETLKVLEK